MAFKGSLAEANLADVCQLLALGRKTGCLSITEGRRLGQIFFDRGRIADARILNRRDRLGDMLVRDGSIAPDQLASTLDAQEREPERRLGELLVERGWARVEDIERYVRRQVEDAILHLFTWSRGSFSFTSGQRLSAGEAPFAIAVEGLLLEAARRIDEWSEVEKKIATFDLVFSADAARVDGAAASLTAEQQRILPLLDGTRSLHHIVESTGLHEFDVGHAVYGLVQAGFARETGRHEPHGPPDGDGGHEARNLAVAFFRAGMLEDAEREFRRVLASGPDDAEARLYLGLVALRAGRPRDAVDEFATLLETNGPSYAAFMNLAVALQGIGRDDDAMHALFEAERLRPDSAAVALERGIIALRRRQVPEARRLFETARDRVAVDSAVPARWYYHSALASALAGDADRAAALVDEGLGRHPESPPLLLLHGLLAERRGDLDTAEQSYTQVVTLDASIVQAHKDLGDVAYRRGAQELALSLFQRASELAPELGDDLYAKLGNLHYRARNRDAALRFWKRALDINPRNDAVKDNLEIVIRAGAWARK